MRPVRRRDVGPEWIHDVPEPVRAERPAAPRVPDDGVLREQALHELEISLDPLDHFDDVRHAAPTIGPAADAVEAGRAGA